MTYADIIENYVKIEYEIEQLFGTELTIIIYRKRNPEEVAQTEEAEDQNDETEEVERGVSR